MRKPLAIDLYAGLGGWAEGFLSEGYDCIGFDIERHQYAVPELSLDLDGSKGTRPVAKRGWTQGCAISLGLEGPTKAPRTRLLEYPAQLVLQDVLTLHGSQFRNAAVIVASPPCQAYSYRAMPWKRAKALPPPSNELFEACFRIQREAIEATRYGCDNCDGRGTFPAGMTARGTQYPGGNCIVCDGAGSLTRHIPLVVENVCGAQPWVGRAKWHYGSFYLWGDVPALMPKGLSIKVPSFRFDGSGGSFQTASVRRTDVGKGARFTSRDCGVEGRKQEGSGPVWFDTGIAKHSSRSNARKAASAQIAKIPFPLAQWIAQCYKPDSCRIIATAV